MNDQARPTAPGDTLVRMPKLADTLVEGTVARWLKSIGDAVAEGEPLVEIETEKVTTELPSPVGGVLLEHAVPEGETVPVDAVIARIGAGAETKGRGDAGTRGAAAEQTERRGEGATGRWIEAKRVGGEAEEGFRAPGPQGGDLPGAVGPQPRATSVAARLLAEHGLGLDEVALSASARRVTKADVLRYVESRDAPPMRETAGGESPLLADEGLVRRQGPAVPERSVGPSTPHAPPPSRSATFPIRAPLSLPLRGSRGSYTLRPLTRMRRAIADHMAKARATIPHGQTIMEVDVTRLVAWREQEKAAFQARERANLTFTVFFVAALGRALRRVASELDLPLPTRSGSSAIDLGIAVALEGGLIVPVVRNVDRLSLGEAARAIQDLANRARAGKLAPDETGGAVMSVTNVGSFGHLTAFPIVPLNQVGILGPGLVEQRPLPSGDGGIRLGWGCLVALVFDRRAMSDFAADRLLRTVVEELGTPLTPILSREGSGRV